MSTHASVRPAPSDLIVDIRRPAFPVESATIALIVVLLAIGAYVCFPLYDDAWMQLTIRELGTHSLAQHMGDRPIFGFLLEQVAAFGSANRLVFVLLNAFLWFGLAIESGILFRNIFPELKEYSIIAACLTVAPIVVQTQLSTALVALPANLATILGYGALLILWRYSHATESTRAWELGAALALALGGVLLSEYGVAAGLVSFVILLGMARGVSSKQTRRRLFVSAGSLLAVTGVGYLLFARTADFAVRPDVAPAHLLHRGLDKWMEIPFSLIAGVWHSLAAAYALELGGITLAWDSKSTVVGILFGVLTAIVLCTGVERRRLAPAAPISPIRSSEGLQGFSARLMILVLGVTAGLLPFSVMGRATILLEYGSRFRIPVMPVAAAVTVAASLNLVRSAMRWIPVAIFGLLIGYASWTFTYTAVEQRRAIESVQSALRPYVSGSENYTVAIVPFNRFESELTANVSSTWPVELEKRLWVVGDVPGRLQFGDRNTCRPTDLLDVDMRGLTRTGKIGQLLWVEASPDKPISVEPYCRAAN